LIFFLALRNLVRNIKNSLIILILLMVIILLFFLGNSILVETDSGLRKSYVDNYTADLVIKVKSDISFSLFGANTPAVGEYFPIPVLKNINQIKEILELSPSVKSFTSQVSGVALMDISGKRYKVPLFGVDGSDYIEFFKGIEIVAGDVFDIGTEGLMMTESRVERIALETGNKPRIGDPVLLTMAGNNGFKIREVPLVGIYRYESSSAGLDDLLLIDVQTLRALNSISLASSDEVSDSEDLFSSGSIDDLFGSDDVEAEQDDSFSVDSVLDLLSSTSDFADEPLAGGGWNFLLLRLKEGVSDKRILNELNRRFYEADLNVEAINWRDAAGLSALMVLLLQVMYNGGFLLVVFAGIIAIVNILIISIYERTGEIGTLRAIGATKKYILSLIFIENLILSFLGGLLAITGGEIIRQIINRTHIAISNSVVQSLMGGTVLKLSFSPSVAFISLLTALVLGIISTIYPVRMALSIEPVTAVAKG